MLHLSQLSILVGERILTNCLILIARNFTFYIVVYFLYNKLRLFKLRTTIDYNNKKLCR